MSIVDIINGILQEQVNAQVVDRTEFCTAPKANVLIGALKNDELWSILLTPNSETIQIDGGTYTTVGDYEVYFLTDQKKLDFDATDNLTRQERCLMVAKDLLYKLHNVKGIKVVNQNITTKLLYSVNDRTCTGISVALRIEQKPECLAEVDGEVSVSATLSNPTTSTINVRLSYEVGVRELVSKGFLWGLNAEEQTNEVVMAGDEYTLSGLDSDAVYFVKPFIATDKATTYGEVVSIKTPESYLITTNDAVGISAVGFTTSGIIYTKGHTIEEQGIAYASHPTPTVDDNTVPVITVNYDYTKTFTELPIGSEVYWRAYAKVNGKNNYSNEKYVKLPSYFMHYKYMTTQSIGGSINLTNCYFYQGESNYVKIGYGWDSCVWSYVMDYVINGLTLYIINYNNTSINFNTYGGHSGVGINYNLQTAPSGNNPSYQEYEMKNGIRLMEANRIAPLPSAYFRKEVNQPVRTEMATPGGTLKLYMNGRFKSYWGEIIVRDSESGPDKLHLVPTIALSDVPSSYEWQGRAIFEGDTGMYDMVSEKFCKAEFTGTNKGIMLNELPF